MPNGFTRSKKGEEMYAAIGREYENTISDNNYAQMLKATANSPHSGRNKQVVMVMVRVLADDGNNYLKYDMEDTRYDAIGAEHEFYCSNMGMYPIPVTQPKIEWGPDMTATEIKTGPIVRYDIGYEILFTKENVDRIHQLANDISQRYRTRYYVQREGGRVTTVPRYEDFRDQTLEDLETGAYLKKSQVIEQHHHAKMERQKEKIV